MQVGGGHRHGSGQRETAQPAGSNLLIAVLLKYFRSMTLSRLLQAKIRAPAGSLGCGCKCCLLLPAQGNYGGSVVSVLGNKLGNSFNGGVSASRFPLLGIASVMLRSDPVPALCASPDCLSLVPGKVLSTGGRSCTARELCLWVCCLCRRGGEPRLWDVVIPPSLCVCLGVAGCGNRGQAQFV